jgi:Kyakuja-Dileera-Zisupton transposase
VDIAPLVERFRYTIPLLHIQNHNDNCTYMYSSAYTEGAGHFHGETAEHPWPYSNLFASQGRQMSHGNRHDLLNGVYGYWNFKKMVGLGAELFLLVAMIKT